MHNHTDPSRLRLRISNLKFNFWFRDFVLQLSKQHEDKLNRTKEDKVTFPRAAKRKRSGSEDGIELVQGPSRKAKDKANDRDYDSGSEDEVPSTIPSSDSNMNGEGTAQSTGKLIP